MPEIAKTSQDQTDSKFRFFKPFGEDTLKQKAFELSEDFKNFELPEDKEDIKKSSGGSLSLGK